MSTSKRAVVGAFTRVAVVAVIVFGAGIGAAVFVAHHESQPLRFGVGPCKVNQVANCYFTDGGTTMVVKRLGANNWYFEYKYGRLTKVETYPAVTP